MAPITKIPKKTKSEGLDDSMNSMNSMKADEFSSSSFSGSDSNMGSDSKQFARVNRVVLNKDSDEYKKRRERNNLAVKKSRNKSKIRTQQTLDRVNQLKQENEMLETKIKILTKELNFLKDLFLAHAGTAHNGQLPEIDMNFLQNNQLADANHEVPNGNAIQMSHDINDADDESDCNWAQQSWIQVDWREAMDSTQPMTEYWRLV